MKLSSTFCVAAALALLQGCDSGTELQPAEDSRPTASRPASSTQIDVFDTFIAPSQIPAVAAANTANLFSNAGFESGVGGWTNCQANAISVSTDAYSGESALQLARNKCFYRSVEVTPGLEYTLSCFVKLTTERAWTGMGLAFANENYDTLAEAPVAVATSGQYTRLETSATAPQGSAFASMWIHSDHGARVDNCSLTTVSDEPPLVPVTSDNQLANGDFSSVDNLGGAASWTSGCGGSVIADGSSLFVTDGACADQALGSQTIDLIASNATSFSCLIADTEGYSDLSVFLDNRLVSVQSINPDDKNTRVSIDIDAMPASNGFVTLYSNGHLRVENCQLVSNSTDATDEDETDTDTSDGSDEPVTPVETDNSEVSARYRLTFNASWSAQTHPVDFPASAHFSGLVGAVHNDQVNFWATGQIATAGIELMAETGDSTDLLTEVAGAISQGTAANAIEGGNIALSPGSVSVEFEVTRDHPMITVTSMVAPSPDWFVGVRDLSLFDGVSFVERVVEDLAVYDSGTDSGEQFISDDLDTQPRIPISLLTSDPSDSDFQNGLPSVGQFIIEKLP